MLLMGAGKQVTASGASAQWEVPKSGADCLSVYNAGAIAAYVLANCSTAEFDAAYALGECIRIQPSMSFSFNGNGRANVKSVCYRTATSTTTLDLAAF